MSTKEKGKKSKETRRNAARTMPFSPQPADARKKKEATLVRKLYSASILCSSHRSNPSQPKSHRALEKKREKKNNQKKKEEKMW